MMLLLTNISASSMKLPHLIQVEEQKKVLASHKIPKDDYSVLRNL